LHMNTEHFRMGSHQSQRFFLCQSFAPDMLLLSICACGLTQNLWMLVLNIVFVLPIH